MNEDERKKHQEQCQHSGNYTGLGVNYLPTAGGLMIFLCSLCTECGKSFVSVTPLTNSQMGINQNQIVQAVPAGIDLGKGKG